MGLTVAERGRVFDLDAVRIWGIVFTFNHDLPARALRNGLANFFGFHGWGGGCFGSYYYFPVGK